MFMDSSKDIQTSMASNLTCLMHIGSFHVHFSIHRTHVYHIASGSNRLLIFVTFCLVEEILRSCIVLQFFWFGATYSPLSSGACQVGSLIYKPSLGLSASWLGAVWGCCVFIQSSLVFHCSFTLPITSRNSAASWSMSGRRSRPCPPALTQTIGRCSSRHWRLYKHVVWHIQSTKKVLPDWSCDWNWKMYM